MKCTMYYDIDGDTGIFTVEDRDAEKCRLAINAEVERLGLEQEKNSIKIDLVTDNKHSAWFMGIPCWYFTDTEEITGRTLFYDMLLTAAGAVILAVSWHAERITGRKIKFNIKVRELE